MSKLLYSSLVAVLYFIIMMIFDLPVQMLGVLLIVQAILVIRLYFRDKIKHYDGQMVVGKSDGGGKLFSLELNSDPEDLEEKDTISFKVVQS